MDPTHRSPLQPLDTLWQARTIFWVVLAGEALAAILALAPGVAGDRLAYFGVASFAIQWIALMSLGLLYLARRPLAGANPVLIAQIALAALLLSTWLVCWLAWASFRDLLSPDEGWLVFVLRLTGIALTVGLLALAAFQNHWRTRQLAVRAKQAELEALQARIRPHFLFNTINTGIALVHARPQQAERLLLDLSDLFRAALAGPSEVSLAEELSLARRYLEIESLRFGERLDVRWDLPEDASAIPRVTLPTLSIQPLVENAIKHGIEPEVSGGYVVVGIRSGAGAVTVTVRNSLPANAPMFSNGHNVGLSAVRARIEAFTQGAGKVETASSGDEFVATLTLPRTESDCPSWRSGGSTLRKISGQ